MGIPTPRARPVPAWDPALVARDPAFAPLSHAAARFADFAQWPLPEDWNTALGDAPWLVSASGARLRFVLQPPKRSRRTGPIDVAALYDERIYTAGEVPSRARDWHDYFNMLVWTSFPHAKRAVNARQRAALRAWLGPLPPARLPGARTREQDALAMLDEGGLLLLCDPATAAGLARQGLAALHTLVASGAVTPLVFGHALYEHLVVAGDAAVRANAVILATESPVPAEPSALLARADALLAARLVDPRSFRAPGSAPGVPLADALAASAPRVRLA